MVAGALETATSTEMLLATPMPSPYSLLQNHCMQKRSIHLEIVSGMRVRYRNDQRSLFLPNLALHPEKEWLNACHTRHSENQPDSVLHRRGCHNGKQLTDG